MSDKCHTSYNSASLLPGIMVKYTSITILSFKESGCVTDPGFHRQTLSMFSSPPQAPPVTYVSTCTLCSHLYTQYCNSTATALQH